MFRKAEVEALRARVAQLEALPVLVNTHVDGRTLTLMFMKDEVQHNVEFYLTNATNLTVLKELTK